MGSLFSYSLAASIVILMLYPVLHIIVNRCTVFRFNRFLLLCAMLLSLTLPAAIAVIPGSPGEPSGYIPATAFIATGISGPPAPATITSAPENASLWTSAAIIIYFTGFFVLLCREIISFIRLRLLIARSDKSLRDGFMVCRLTGRRLAPFSWGKYIFLHDSELSDNSAGIYLHEKTHTEKRHWIDVLFADLFCIFMWYNPFAWQTYRLVKLNHEFEADAAVVRTGIDTYDYQRLLITKALGSRTIPGTNSFAAGRRNFRKRVMIMNRKPTSWKAMLLAVFTFPAIIVCVLALTSPASTTFLSSISAYSFESNPHSQTPGTIPSTDIFDNYKSLPEVSTEEASDTIIELPSLLHDQKAFGDILRMSLALIDVDRETKINIGIVIDEEGRVKEVVTDNTDNPLVKTIIDQAVNGVRFEQITHNGTPIQTRFNIPVTLKKKE